MLGGTHSISFSGILTYKVGLLNSTWESGMHNKCFPGILNSTVAIGTLCLLSPSVKCPVVAIWNNNRSLTAGGSSAQCSFTAAVWFLK